MGNVALPRLKHRAGDFFAGFGLPFQAASVILKSRRLTVFTALSALVTCACLALLVWGLWGGTPALVSHLWSRPDNAVASALWHVLVALTFVVLLVIGANTLPLAVLAPLQDPISEATEEQVGGFVAPPFTVGRALSTGALSLVHTLKRVALLIAGHLVLALLNFIPGVGNTAWSVLSHFWTMWWLCAEYLSGPMARHLYPFRDVRRAMAGHKAAAFGFGAAIYFMLWVPVLNFFFIPLAIVGGTLLFRSIKDSGELPGALPSGT